jgi:hypothetical protein
MNLKWTLGAFGALLVGGSLLQGCGSESDDKGAARSTVKVQFENSTALSSSLGDRKNRSLTTLDTGERATPDELQFKLVAVFMFEEGKSLNDGSGEIWVHPDCKGNHCPATQITDYVDFVDPEILNTRLNAEAKGVLPGSYKNINVHFCANQNDGSVKFTLGDHEYEVDFVGTCGTGIDFENLLTVAEGETVTVNLAYDVENSIRIKDEDDESAGCVAGEGDYDEKFVCFNVDDLSFVPTIE